MKVSIEKKTASKDWSILESQTVKFQPVHGKVKITEDGFDFGGETYVAGAPIDSADSDLDPPNRHCDSQGTQGS